MIANGSRFGQLIVKAPATSTSNGNARSLCRCDCGTQTITRNAWLKSGRVDRCRACAKSANVSASYSAKETHD